jgi:hypothetical protein
MSLRLSIGVVLLSVLSLLCASGSSAFSPAGPQGSLTDTESPFLSSETQNTHLSDRENAGLRGPVNSSTEETIPFDGTKFVTTEYSRDGRLLTKRVVYPDNPDFLSTWIYNADGRLVEIDWDSSDKPMETREYDVLGRLKTVIRDGLVITLGGVAQVSRTDVHYDEQGHKTTVQHFDPVSPSFGGRSLWDGIVDAGTGVPKGGSVTMLYDENDQPTELQVLGADGHLVKKIVRVYNQDGFVTEEKPSSENPASEILDRMPAERRAKLSPEDVKQMYHVWGALSVGKNPQLGMFYTYDEKNRLTKICKRDSAIEKTITVTYNDQGDKVEKRTAFTDNQTHPTGTDWSGPPMSEMVPKVPDIHYVYKYDSSGNWTELTITGNDTLNSDERSSVSHRKLSYYPQ